MYAISNVIQSSWLHNSHNKPVHRILCIHSSMLNVDVRKKDVSINMISGNICSFLFLNTWLLLGLQPFSLNTVVLVQTDENRDLEMIILMFASNIILFQQSKDKSLDYQWNPTWIMILSITDQGIIEQITRRHLKNACLCQGKATLSTQYLLNHGVSHVFC